MPDALPSVSIAIVTYNRDHVLCGTLRSIFNQCYPGLEVIVVDQTKMHQPQTRRYLEELKRRRKIKYFFSDTPNTPRARNIALRNATKDVLIFVDDDVELTPGFILNHVKIFTDKKVAAVGGKIIPKPFYKDPEGEKCKDAVKDWWWFKSDWDVRTPTTGIPGCNMSFRKKILTELGGFDETFVNECWGEETDVCLRLRNAGHQIFYDPAPALYHLKSPAGGSRTRRADQTLNVSLYRNAAYLFLKNFSKKDRLKYFILIYRCNVGREKSEILKSPRVFGRFIRRNAAFVYGSLLGYATFKKNFH
jgi:GT2 family glycosyltransferase